MTLLGPAEIRALADRLGVRPTKTLGQNFLHDPNTIRRIVRTAALGAGEPVLEIGPGLGSLTLGLLEAGHPVIAVEIDAVLAEALPRDGRRAHPSAADRRHGRRAAADQLPGEPTALGRESALQRRGAGRAAPARGRPVARADLVMVQAEVADRLVAPPGSKAYGVPQRQGGLVRGGHPRRRGAGSGVLAGAERRVGLVRLARRDPPATTATRAEVFAVVDAAFAQRRKTLRAALAGWAGSPAAAEDALRARRHQPAARGETPRRRVREDRRTAPSRQRREVTGEVVGVCSMTSLMGDHARRLSTKGGSTSEAARSATATCPARRGDGVGAPGRCHADGDVVATALTDNRAVTNSGCAQGVRIRAGNVADYASAAQRRLSVRCARSSDR